MDGCRIRELPDGGRQFLLDDPVLAFISIDERVHLQFGPTELIVGAPFEVELERKAHRLDPERPRELGPLLALYPSVVRWVWTSSDGELTIVLESGARVTVRPDPTLTAWELGRVRCLPGAGR